MLTDAQNHGPRHIDVRHIAKHCMAALVMQQHTFSTLQRVQNGSPLVYIVPDAFSLAQGARLKKLELDSSVSFQGFVFQLFHFPAIAIIKPSPNSLWLWDIYKYGVILIVVRLWSEAVVVPPKAALLF